MRKCFVCNQVKPINQMDITANVINIGQIEEYEMQDYICKSHYFSNEEDYHIDPNFENIQVFEGIYQQ